MSTERDELARDIFLADNSNAAPGLMEKEWDENPTAYSYAHHIAQGLIRAGYRRPRQVTTVEELDALPEGTVVRTDNGEVFERQPEGPYCDGPHDWQSIEGTFWNGETFCFPVTVLHVGGAE